MSNNSQKSNDEIVNEMVSRFLGWKLPHDFVPDCGISFSPTILMKSNDAYWPSGTNLLHAGQAREMVEHMLSGVASQSNPEMTSAADDVLAERRRQVEAEGWTPEHDDDHGDGAMCMAAVCYAEWDHYEHPSGDGNGLVPANWPWATAWWKPRDRRRNLVKAAALLLAEIERLDRIESPKGKG